MNRIILSIAAAASLAAVVPAPATAQGVLPTTRLSAGIHLITAEVAARDAERTRGLMFREALAPNHGMLFVFDAKSVQCMWMRNTLIALSAAFIEDDGRIVNIEDMQPRSDATHCARAPVRYVLEMPQGWFAQRGIKPGSVIGGLAEGVRPK
jgi:uncharacterized membrane protein (UPF0127 family)